MAILKPLKENTTRFQYAYGSGSIAEIIPAMDELCGFFEHVRNEFGHENRSESLYFPKRQLS